MQVLTDVSNIEMRYRPFRNYGYALGSYKDLVQQTDHPMASARLAEIAVAAGELELARETIQQSSSKNRPWEIVVRAIFRSKWNVFQYGAEK